MKYKINKSRPNKPFKYDEEQAINFVVVNKIHSKHA